MHYMYTSMRGGILYAAAVLHPYWYIDPLHHLDICPYIHTSDVSYHEILDLIPKLVS